MKTTMKAKQQVAQDIISRFTPNGSNGNAVWQNNFYTAPNGTLWNIQYKNGKLFDVICYGR